LSTRAAIMAVLLAPLLMGGACEKKPSKGPDNGAIAALERAGSGSAADGPVDSTPLAGVDLSKLDDAKKQLFYKLVGSLSSPCGKAHSLRTSATSDTSCKRAPFAIRYLLAFLEEDVPEQMIRDEYDHKYKPGDAVKIDVSHAPHVGPVDAPVRLVEFFDYGCPHCEEFKPMLERVIADQGSKIVVYFMNYPLGHFPGSDEAAAAAIVANGQHKFKEMHDVLYAHRTEHDHGQILGYAKDVGLDMTKFEADLAAAAAQVKVDKQQGENAGVDSTPTVYFNDRKYPGPMSTKFLNMWIEEELAVNR
jgi:protein-disulfide isomerase